jgi:hypothetical protein
VAQHKDEHQLVCVEAKSYAMCQLGSTSASPACAYIPTQALSAKGIDIRKREAEALRARIEREMSGGWVGPGGYKGQSCINNL